MNNENNKKKNHNFLYDHSEVISGIGFFILVFVAMAVGSHFFN